MHERILEVCRELGDNAGTDSSWDRFKVGYIQALKDVLDTDITDVGGDDGN